MASDHQPHLTTIVPIPIDSHQALPAPFLSKTFKLVEDPNSDNIISWNTNGTTFIVWRPTEFARDLLPKYFKHNNFSSFVRQLNTYGFRKLVLDRWEFANQFFKKGQKHLLVEIHRRKTVHSSPGPTSQCCRRPSSPSNSADDQALSSDSSALTSPRKLADHTSDETQTLIRENLLLMSELSCVRKLCSDLLMFIQRNVKVPLQDLGSINKLLQSTYRPSDGIVEKKTLPSYTQSQSGERWSQAVVAPEILNRHTPERLRWVQTNNSVWRRQQGTSATGEGTEQVWMQRGEEQEEGDRSPPKLFGVPLCGKKRPYPFERARDSTTTCVHDESVPSQFARAAIAID